MRIPALLADGAWHSGPSLAEQLGISRAAVSKQVSKARELGLQINSVQGRGYQLREAFEPLTEDSIKQYSSAATRQYVPRLEVFSTLDSTSAYLQRNDAGPRNRACFAEHQSGGRGRRGRQWISPYGANLYFSLAWQFEQTPPALGALSLAVGVELAEMLRAIGAQAQLKWPNDIYLDAKKLGGILIDHRGEVAASSRVVVGVGLNLTMQSGQAQAIDQPWTALAQHIVLPSRNQIAAQALDAVVRALTGFAAEGFAGYRRRWQQFDLARGKAVQLESGNQTITGRAAGVAADGALMLECETGIQRFYAGEISLRVPV